MNFYLDTASLAEIDKWTAQGLVEGVTTNPALLSQECCDARERIAAIASCVKGPVSAQVTARTAGQMVEQAIELHRIAPNIVVKIPPTEEGYVAAVSLKKQGVPLNVTLLFEPAQALRFLKIEVDFVSIVIGRPEDFGIATPEAVSHLRHVILKLGLETKVIAASLRNPSHLWTAILGGADIVTVPPLTWRNIIQHPLTLQGETDFLAAWDGLSSVHRASYDEPPQRQSPP